MFEPETQISLSITINELTWLNDMLGSCIEEMDNLAALHQPCKNCIIYESVSSELIIAHNIRRQVKKAIADHGQ